MARFRAVVEGQRGSASRLGSTTSGITSHTHGWSSGVRVVGGDAAGQDLFRVFTTGGAGGGTERQVGSVMLVDSVPVFTVEDKEIQEALCACGAVITRLTAGMLAVVKGLPVRDMDEIVCAARVAAEMADRVCRRRS